MRVTVSGTHDRDVMGRPATGRRFEVTSVGIFLLQVRQPARRTPGVFDPLGMLARLGAPG